jgi:transmembrane sensor
MKAKQNIEDQDWEAIANSIYNDEPDSVSGEITLSSQNISTVEIEQIIETAKQVDRYFEMKKYPPDQAWDKVRLRIHRNSKSRQTKIGSLFSNPIFRVAAALIFAALLLVSGYEIFYNPSAGKNMMEVSASNQILKSFILPDGSQVSLNTNTKINYPKIFTGNTREVSIEGEAFFQVKPNKEKPFIIHAGNAQIKVLGTSFNVNAYAATKSVEVIVETGKVQIINNATESNVENELILTPGEKGTLVFLGNSLIKTTNQNPNFLAWKTRNLVFKATSLSEVIENLEKVYKVQILLADPKLSMLLLTAQFNDYPLDFILKVIETTFELESNEVNGQYILKARS